MLGFSIIATCYNHLPFLAGLIEMLNQQTFTAFELILVDNNSQDGSADWIQNLPPQTFPVKKILNPENLGICKAFNQGEALAAGKYLIDLAPDDTFLPKKLEKNFQLLEKYQSHFLFSDCKAVDQKGEKLYLFSERFPFHYSCLLYTSPSPRDRG